MAIADSSSNGSAVDDVKAERKRRLIELLHKAASKAVQEEDPWAAFDIPAVPAERVIRHLYDPHTQTWSTDETIVKIERTPFTHGGNYIFWGQKFSSFVFCGWT